MTPHQKQRKDVESIFSIERDDCLLPSKTESTTSSSCATFLNESDENTKNHQHMVQEKRGTTIVSDASCGISYIKCTSKDTFQIPDEMQSTTSDNTRDKQKTNDKRRHRVNRGATVSHRKITAEEVNKTLNLNLGLPINPLIPLLRRTLKIITEFLLIWCGLELVGCTLWCYIPLAARHGVMKFFWSIYVRLHMLCIGRRSGIHVDASLEYHAFTSVVWWGRLFPVTIARMRFALNQLQVWYPPVLSSVSHGTGELRLERVDDAHGVSGVYVHLNNDLNATENVKEERRNEQRVVLWIYGGAYLAGDVDGNIGMAQNMAKCCKCDVFVVQYRLLPEHELQDSIQDVCDAYDYLLHVRKIPFRCIQVFGISSGAGLAVSLLQRLNDQIEEGKKKWVPSSNSANAKKKDTPANDIMPAGAVLMGPFVDYTEPKGSMSAYVEHDLIVNQSVYETGIPYLAIKLGSMENRIKASPVYQSFAGGNIPPLCVVVSEHECCYDQSILLVNNARRDGVDVTLGLWRYMCHTFPLFSHFIPEGKQAQGFMYEWIVSHFE